MALKIQLRRGTTVEHSSFTGAVGEVTVDTSKNALVVHDGVTVGGFPLTSSGGVISVKIPANADLNNYKTVGLYFCDTDTTTILNNPTQYGFSLFVEKVSDTAVNQKLVTHKNGGGKIYTRSFSTSWSDWNIVPFEKDVLGGTYKDVTNARLDNVTYTNTSGKPIFVMVSATAVTSSITQININPYVDSMLLPNSFATNNIGASSIVASTSFIVPNGSSYRIYIQQPYTSLNWVELS